MPDEFEDPAEPGGGIEWTPLANRLLLFTVHSVEQNINTAFGVKDAVRADVVVLDGPTAGEAFPNTLVFPGVLIGQLKTKTGRQVLGRLGYGQAKAGQKPPWKLEAATDDEKQRAMAYRASTVTSPGPDRDPWASPTGQQQGGGNPPF